MADLEGADLNYALAYGANFRGTCLTKAILDYGRLGSALADAVVSCIYNIVAGMMGGLKINLGLPCRSKKVKQMI